MTLPKIMNSPGKGLMEGLRRRKVIIDSDAGLDDSQAILLALADPAVDVIALTCVGGNTSLDNVSKNCLKVLTAADRLEIPVYPGCKAPIIGNKDCGPPFHGLDGLGGCIPPLYPDVDLSLLKAEHASNTLIRLAKASPGEITLICLGPLSNLALAIKLDPDMTKLLKGVYLMGGNHQGEGNVTITGEFNFYYDPEAAHIVTGNTFCTLTMVGWEVCSRPDARLDPVWVEEYFDQPTRQGQFLHQIHEKILQTLREDHGGDPRRQEMIVCDEWVVALFLDESTAVASDSWFTTVELAGTHTRGQCVVDKRQTYHSDGTFGETEGKNKARHILELNRPLFKEMLMRMIQRPSFPR